MENSFTSVNYVYFKIRTTIPIPGTATGNDDSSADDDS